MERRLTVEQHNVSIDQVAVDHVTFADINRIRIDVAQADRTIIGLQVH